MIVRKFLEAYEGLEPMPRVTCSDGFSFGMQNGQGHYATKNTVEVRYPSQKEELLSEHTRNQMVRQKGIYSYVPIEVVDAIIKKHGGIFCVEPSKPYTAIDGMEYKRQDRSYNLYLGDKYICSVSGNYTLNRIKNLIDINHIPMFDIIISINKGDDIYYDTIMLGKPLSKYEPFDKLKFRVSGRIALIEKKGR